MTLTLTMSITFPGDDHFWHGLSAAKKLIAAKDFGSALKSLKNLKAYARNNRLESGTTLDEPISRCLLGLGREADAVALLEPYLRANADLLAFKRLIKIFGDRGRYLATSGEREAAIVDLNKALSLAHIYAMKSTLKPAGDFWRGDESEIAVARLFDEILASRGSLYSWTYANDGRPFPHCLMCDRDLKALRHLSDEAATSVPIARQATESLTPNAAS